LDAVAPSLPRPDPLPIVTSPGTGDRAATRPGDLTLLPPGAPAAGAGGVAAPAAGPSAGATAPSHGPATAVFDVDRLPAGEAVASRRRRGRRGVRTVDEPRRRRS